MAPMDTVHHDLYLNPNLTLLGNTQAMDSIMPFNLQSHDRVMPFIMASLSNPNNKSSFWVVRALSV